MYYKFSTTTHHLSPHHRKPQISVSKSQILHNTLLSTLTSIFTHPKETVTDTICN